MKWATDALRIRPDDPDALADRANWNAELGRWRDAAADFRRVYDLARPKHGNDAAVAGYEAALLLLQTGDADGYCRICQSLQRDLGASPTSDARAYFLWTCLLGPDAVTDYEPLLKIAADQGVLASPSRPFYLAASYYRAGKYHEAARLFDQKEPSLPGQGDLVIDWWFRAMTYRRAGRAEDAKQWMDKAVAWMSDAQQAKLQPGQKMADWPWTQRLELSLLRREAEAALKEPAPKPEK